MEAFIAYTTILVLVNGITMLLFCRSRGVQHEHLLSPFIFIIKVEALNRLMLTSSWQGLRC